MMADIHEDGRVQDEASLASKSLSRREFLKVAGIAGATIGVGAGLGGLVAACGGGTEETTTTAGAVTTGSTTGATTATTSGASTTTVSALELGREIKLGFVTPTTGGLGVFGIADEYTVGHWKELLADGVVCGDGKKHPVNIIKVDTQSDINRASQVAGDLISNNKVDIIMAGASPDTVNPVADQAEALGCPCLTTDCPWQPYFFGRKGDPAVGFKWTYHVQWGAGEMVAIFLDMWTKVPNNKIVGSLWPNDADGNVFRESWTPLLTDAGYTVIDGGAYQNGTEDYGSIITKFKKEGAEILTGVPLPTDFANFWAQAAQQSYKPTIATVGKALLVADAVEALGPVAGIGLTSELWWHPTFPFKSSFNGETCQQVADDFEAKTGHQWIMPLLHNILFEMAVDTLKRTKNVDDKNDIIAQVSTIKIDSLGGPLDFSAAVGTPFRPVPNVVVNPLSGGQWEKGDKYMYQIKVVSNVSGTMIPIQKEMKPLAL
jgi:branched-chain amino acid transport system substrate-binding protein